MVVSEDFPYVPIRAFIGGWEISGVALLDTGFSGDLIIPEGSLPSNLGAPNHYNSYRVADGRSVPTPMYAGNVELGMLPPVTNLMIGVMGDRFIVGVGVIERYTITLEYGQRIIIEE